MGIITPEQLLGIKPKKIVIHHGTCDFCRKRMVLVVHFNYDKQPNRDFRLCQKCLKKSFGMFVKNVDKELEK